jgi:hypothetical protein
LKLTVNYVLGRLADFADDVVNGGLVGVGETSESEQVRQRFERFPPLNSRAVNAALHSNSIDRFSELSATLAEPRLGSSWLHTA